MHSPLKKVLVILGVSIALAGCTLTEPFVKKETSPAVEGTPTPPTTQTEATPSSEMGSPSYKMGSTPSKTTTGTSAKTESDDPDNLQKDLDSVTIESDFGSLVQ